MGPDRFNMTRRRLLAGAAASLAGPGLAAALPREDLRLGLIGQCLIRYDLRERPWPGLPAIRARLERQHAVFSDLEVAIKGPREGAPTRKPETLHTASPVVLDALRAAGVTALATSNNHAFDIGTGGILDAIEALEARQIPFAGTGRDLAAAAKAGVQETAAGRFAFVAFATGFVRDGGMATGTRAGVNEVRRNPDGSLVEEDVGRVLAAIRRARDGGATVLAYQHNHYWESDVARTPEWQRALARACIDAGAAVFCGHGPPLLHGMEVYQGAPLFYCLGSFIFQTKKDEDAYGAANWESLIVECRFRDGRFQAATITPVVLAATGQKGDDDLQTRGLPSLAPPARARQTLERVAGLSQALGYRLNHDGLQALISA